MEELALSFITYGRQLASSGMYRKAFDYYVTAFDKWPGTKDLHEPEFRAVLIRLNEVLAAGGKMENIFANFERASELFPNNMHLLNEIGKYLYKYSFFQEAWCHFQKALKLDSGFVNAEKNLNSLKNLMVERWHFRMLNDKVRNDAYHLAIHETLIPVKDSILDVGTGTGLLSIFAYECAPMAITACDSSDVMVKLADSIVLENGMKEILVVNKLSTDMDYIDIGGKRSLLVTEMFDAGLFGEHVLQSLSHALQNLMTNVGRVIPSKADFFVVGVQSDHFSMKYHLGLSAKQILNVSSLNVHIVTCGETYDCEDVHLCKDLKYLSDPQCLLSVDFNSYDDMQDKLTRYEPYNVEFKIKEPGQMDVVIGWFNLYLTKDVMITSDPRSKARANAWQQAVFFDNVPVTVAENQIVVTQFLMNGGKLGLSPDCKMNIMRISPETLRFLNDTEYIGKITSCLGMASIYLGQIAEISQINIVDLCPFPMFGLLMLKRGAQSLICHAKTQHDQKFFKKVFKANKIPLSKITFLLGNNWTQEVFGTEKYHAIFYNILELCGDIDFQKKELAQYLKNGHLLHGGLFMPANISLVGQIVDSHWLDINNRLFDENVRNYKIAKHLNVYQVSQNFSIDFTHLQYKPLSEPLVLAKSCTNMGSEVVNVPIVNAGDANAILCWYNIELLEDLGEISTNRSTSFIDGTAFLANPKVTMNCGDVANVLRCVDTDGSFKLVIDVEAK